MNTRTTNLWFVFHRAEDIPGEWVGHCLELDVISQGTSLSHTMRMLGEACAMVMVDDFLAKRDPQERRAPDEYWKALYSLIAHGEPVEFTKIDESKLQSAACQVVFITRSVSAQPQKVEQAELQSIPMAWSEAPQHPAPCCS